MQLKDFKKGDKFFDYQGNERIFLETKGDKVLHGNSIDAPFASIENIKDFEKMIEKQDIIRKSNGTVQQGKADKIKETEEENDLYGFGENETKLLRGRMRNNLNSKDLSKTDIEELVKEGNCEVVIINNRKKLTRKTSIGLLNFRANRTQIRYFEHLTKRS